MINKMANFISLLKRKPSEQKNIDAYSSDDVVGYYTQQPAYLQPAEKAVIQMLESQLSRFTMLDIGVGAGRTSYFFAPLVKDYIGVDYSTGMVQACRKLYPMYRFEESDVRSLNFKDNTFDFVLFSFNGLDSISASDRLNALAEIYRVLKPGGYFAFSAHNLSAITRLFNFASTNPKKWYKAFILRRANKEFRSLGRKDEAVVFDGTHGYKISNYYIKPLYQLKQLIKTGFINTNMIGQSGNLLSTEEAERTADVWVHFICNKS